MELIASIEALKLIKTKSKINLFTDSKYVIDGIKVWIKNWKSNNWRTKTNKDVKNLDLWKELDDLHSFHSVQWTWVRGIAEIDIMMKLIRLQGMKQRKFRFFPIKLRPCSFLN